jgi:hypothetical protein
LRPRSTPIVEISSQPLCLNGESTAISGASGSRKRSENASVMRRDVKYWFSAKIVRRALAIASRWSCRISLISG